MNSVEKIQRNSKDIFIIQTEEEEHFRKKFKSTTTNRKCTMCGKTTTDFHPHPALRVIVCSDCFQFYDNTVFLSNRDGTDKNCRWCAKLTSNYCCSNCTTVFCKHCLNRNFEPNYVEKNVKNNPEWKCLICNQKQLWALRAQFANANNETETDEEIDLMKSQAVNKMTNDKENDDIVVSSHGTKNNSRPNSRSSTTSEPDFMKDLTDLMAQKLSSDIAKEAQAIFDPTKEKFERLIKKIQTEFNAFSNTCAKNTLETPNDVNNLVEKVSYMCTRIREVLTWIDKCNKKSYKQWLDQYIPENKSSSKSKTQQLQSTNHSPTLSGQHSNKSDTNSKLIDSESNLFSSDQSFDLLQSNTNDSKSNLDDPIPNNCENNLNLKTETTDPLNSSQETETCQLNKEPGKKQTKQVLQLKNVKTESETSGVSENFMNFLDEIKLDLTNVIKNAISNDNEDPKTPELKSSDNNNLKESNSDDNNTELQIKSEQLNGSVFSNETLIRESSQLPAEEPIKMSTSQTQCLSENGISKLQDRILTDFHDADVNPELVVVQYLCDKTGELFDGFDSNILPDLLSEVKENNSSQPEVELNVPNDANVDSDYKEETTELLLENDCASIKSLPICEEQSEKVFESMQTEDLNTADASKTPVKEEIEPKTEGVFLKDELFSYLDLLFKDDLKDEYSSNVSTQSLGSEEDLEQINEIEKQKEIVYKYLVDSDKSDSYSSISVSSSSNWSFSEDQSVEDEHRGYIKTLDIANELDKLRSSTFALRNESSTDVEDNSSTSNAHVESETTTHDPRNDPKFTQKCEVKLERMNFDDFKSNEKRVNKDSTNEYANEKEINKLLNLDSLEKKKRFISSSDSDSKTDQNTNRDRQIKKFKSKEYCDTSSNDSSAEDSSNLLSDLEDFDLDKKNITTNEKSGVETNLEELFSDSDTSFRASSVTSDSESEIEKKKDKKINKKDKKNNSDDPKEMWKKDSLLTSRLTVSDSDKTKPNDIIVTNDLLKEQEKQFFEKPDKTLNEKNNILIDDDAIVLSDTDTLDSDSSTDSDLIIIPAKRKHKNDDDDNDSSPHKKGRKNIKKLLDDSELQEETQIADLEEEKRKERISIKNKSLDAVLSQTSLSQEEIGLVLDVDEINKTPLVKVPQILVNPLKPHQIHGIKFMWDVCFESANQIKETSGAGCILAHCMGLGKTMQVVVLTYTLLTHDVTSVRHALIICPLSTVFNWRNEFESTLKNAPDKINIFDIRSDKHHSYKQRIFEVKKWRLEGGVLIMGYDSFSILVNEEKLEAHVTKNYQKIVLEALIDPGPEMVVCDEGHILKSGKTRKFKALNRLKTKRRIILTGTPLQNNLIEYWHMVSFVKPRLLGTFKEYTNRFVNPIMNGQYEDSSPSDIQLMKKRSHVLHKKLQTTVHRYELSELKQYLPNKYEHVLFIQLSELQIKLYELYIRKLENVKQTRNLFQNFHDLQNIWTHPALLHLKYEKKKTYDEDFDPNLDPDTVLSQNSLGEHWYKDHIPSDLTTNLNYGSKMIILFSIIKECCALGDKLLVFSSSIAELDLIEQFLKNNTVNQTWIRNLDYYRMDGSVLPEKRMQYCNSFNNVENTRARLFLISHKVGGLGLNLIAANRVVLMDVNWNPAYDTQSVFRVYRFGQTKECFIYRLVSLGTMEELVYSRAVTKLAISCRVVDEQQIRRHFKEDDRHKLYKLNTDYLNQEPLTPVVPADRLLAKLWGLHKPVLYNFKDHQSMLENLTHEELNEEEMMMAWEEFKREEEAERLRLAELMNTRDLMRQQMQQPQFRIPMNPSNIQSTIDLHNPNIVQYPFPQIQNMLNKNIRQQQQRNVYFNKYTFNAAESIVPDINPTNKKQNSTSNNLNQTPRNTNNNSGVYYFNNLPSTSGLSNVPNTKLSNNTRKVYGNPKSDIEGFKQNAIKTNIKINPVNTATKKMPKLVPVNQNQKENIVNLQQLAKNGVEIIASPKRNNVASNDDVITLE